MGQEVSESTYQLSLSDSGEAVGGEVPDGEVVSVERAKWVRRKANASDGLSGKRQCDVENKCEVLFMASSIYFISPFSGQPSHHYRGPSFPLPLSQLFVSCDLVRASVPKVVISEHDSRIPPM